MKKIVMICLAAVCVIVLAVTFAGRGQQDAVQEIQEEGGAQVSETTRVEGLIVSVQEGSFIMQDKDLGEIQVNLSDETVLEGVDAAAFEFGQYVFVDFDGKMTRSLPPQISGMKVAVYAVNGTVIEIGENSVTIEQNDGGSEAVVFLPEGAPELHVGDEIIAYTTGAMTMSLPPQTTALAIEVTAAAE